jgi:hypothetical protein
MLDATAIGFLLANAVQARKQSKPDKWDLAAGRGPKAFGNRDLVAE